MPIFKDFCRETRELFKNNKKIVYFGTPCSLYIGMWGIIFYPFWHEKAIKTPNISLKSCQTLFLAILGHFWHTRCNENYLFLFWGDTAYVGCLFLCFLGQEIDYNPWYKPKTMYKTWFLAIFGHIWHTRYTVNYICFVLVQYNHVGCLFLCFLAR